jgi:GTP cyclohydrolase IB
LPEVGVRGVAALLAIVDSKDTHGPVPALLSFGIALPADRRGAHLSRFGEALLGLGGQLRIAELPAHCRELARRLEASSARISVSFPLLVERRAPVSGASGLIRIEAGVSVLCDGDRVELRQQISVPAQSVCPCSKEMSERGAHNQRCLITANVESATGLAYLALIEALESTASCPVFPVLKRPDEQHVTERAYERPAFVEDIAREAARVLSGWPGALRFRVDVTSEESIHPHDAYAVASRD